VDTAGAMLKYDIVSEWTDVSLELYTQAVLRVPFVLQRPRVLRGTAVSIDYLRHYLTMLFT
jgi:hypothetical protein